MEGGTGVLYALYATDTANLCVAAIVAHRLQITVNIDTFVHGVINDHCEAQSSAP